MLPTKLSHDLDNLCEVDLSVINTVQTPLCRDPLATTTDVFDANNPPIGTSYTLGGQTWVTRDPPWRPCPDGHNLLFRNTAALNIARWVHPDELQHLHRLGVVTVPK